MSEHELLRGLLTGGLDDFLPDPALDALYRQAVVVAREFGWAVPSRAEFEGRYKAEIAASRRNEQ